MRKTFRWNRAVEEPVEVTPPVLSDEVQRVVDSPDPLTLWEAMSQDGVIPEDFVAVDPGLAHNAEVLLQEFYRLVLRFKADHATGLIDGDEEAEFRSRSWEMLRP